MTERRPLKVVYKLFNSSLKFLYVLVPSIFYLLPGAYLSSAYTNISWFPLLLLYLLILTNQLLEKMYSRLLTGDRVKILLAEIANISLIIYFYSQSSFVFGNLLLFYSIFIHIQNIFDRYNIAYLGILVVVFFKIIVMNIASFYLNASFIPSSIILVILPFILPFLMVELDRRRKNTAIIKLTTLCLSYFVGLVVLWGSSGLWSLLIFLSLPAGYYALKWNNYLGSKIFYTSFSLIAFLIILLFS